MILAISTHSGRRARHDAGVLALLVLLASLPALAAEGAPLGHEQLAAIRTVTDAAVSPDGAHAAFTLSVPRRPGKDEDGAPWVELHVVPTSGGPPRGFVQGEVNVSAIRFSPDGRLITYLAERNGDEHKSLWAIPLGGGESRKLLEFESDVEAYELSPDGTRIAFLARPAESKGREQAKEKGYKQEVFEEDWLPRKVWIAPLAPWDAPVEDPSVEPEPAEGEEEDGDEPRALEIEGAVFNLTWGPDAKRLALGVAPRPLIDDRYMLRRLHVVDAETGDVSAVLDNPGKLGDFRFSPDGKLIAMITADDPNDPRGGRLKVAPSGGGPLRDLIPGFEGHVVAIAWQDVTTVMFVANVGSETTFGEVGIDGSDLKTHLRSGAGDAGAPILSVLGTSADGQTAVFVGQRPTHPPEIYAMRHGEQAARRLSTSNPWLGRVALARQEVIRHKARDGLELEGILMHPLEPALGSPAPLLLMVHGGPEANDRNGWLTSYSRPGQLAAGKGYAVLYPNYRGSTGRGVAFSKLSQGDAAGKEFDDLVDAVDHLSAQGIADSERVGILGGSYGGYATAWCSTRHTDRFRAGVMFVGISNKVSKGLTTEIPIEDKMSHTLFDPWTKWQFSLERSPIFWAEQSRTALLIAGGSADTRVHPSQSLQLYRALKLIGKTPVRYVRYPGEGHGNRLAAARDDYSRRLMRWMDHFVLGDDREPPPWDLGLGQDEEDEEEDGEDEEGQG